MLTFISYNIFNIGKLNNSGVLLNKFIYFSNLLWNIVYELYFMACADQMLCSFSFNISTIFRSDLHISKLFYLPYYHNHHLCRIKCSCISVCGLFPNRGSTLYILLYNSATWKRAPPKVYQNIFTYLLTTDFLVPILFDVLVPFQNPHCFTTNTKCYIRGCGLEAHLKRTSFFFTSNLYTHLR